MLFVTLFAVAFAAWYWDTQRKTFVSLASDKMCSLSTTYVKAMSIGEAKEKGAEAANEGISVPLTAALHILWGHFKKAWPFIWDFFRLIVMPYLFERMISNLFGL